MCTDRLQYTHVFVWGQDSECDNELLCQNQLNDAGIGKYITIAQTTADVQRSRNFGIYRVMSGRSFVWVQVVLSTNSRVEREHTLLTNMPHERKLLMVSNIVMD